MKNEEQETKKAEILPEKELSFNEDGSVAFPQVSFSNLSESLVILERRKSTIMDRINKSKTKQENTIQRNVNITQNEISVALTDNNENEAEKMYKEILEKLKKIYKIPEDLSGKRVYMSYEKDGKSQKLYLWRDKIIIFVNDGNNSIRLLISKEDNKCYSSIYNGKEYPSGPNLNKQILNNTIDEFINNNLKINVKDDLSENENIGAEKMYQDIVKKLKNIYEIPEDLSNKAVNIRYKKGQVYQNIILRKNFIVINANGWNFIINKVSNIYRYMKKEFRQKYNKAEVDEAINQEIDGFISNQDKCEILFSS